MLFFQTKITKTKIFFKFKILLILCYIFIFIIIKIPLFSKNALNNHNYEINKTIKKELQNLINKKLKKKINYIDSLFIIGNYRFGNFLISLNKAIIFCEIFCCKRIIINSNQNIFINKYN